MTAITVQTPTTADGAFTAPLRSGTRSAYGLVALVYLSVFGAGALLWGSLLLYLHGLVPRPMEHLIVTAIGGPAGDVDGSVAAWLTASALLAYAILTGRIGNGASPGRRRAVLAVLAAVVPSAVWVGWQAAAVAGTGDLWWRVVELSGVAALIAALARVCCGPGLAELGLRRRRGDRDAAGFHFAMSWSLIALVAATALVAVTVAVFHPHALAGVVGAASGTGQPWWFWAVVFAVNALVEELVCTAWLVAVLRRANRPWWEIYAVAAVLRVLFHLYMGVPGIAAAVFAVANILIFQRTARLAPLVAAHALFDTATNNGDRTVTITLIALALAVVILPDRTVSRLRRIARRARPQGGVA